MTTLESHGPLRHDGTPAPAPDGGADDGRERPWVRWAGAGVWASTAPLAWLLAATVASRLGADRWGPTEAAEAVGVGLPAAWALVGVVLGGGAAAGAAGVAGARRPGWWGLCLSGAMLTASAAITMWIYTRI